MQPNELLFERPGMKVTGNAHGGVHFQNVGSVSFDAAVALELAQAILAHVEPRPAFGGVSLTIPDKKE